LDRENQITLGCEDEGYAEYVSWLAETVAKVVDWSDHRQVCILANGLDLPDELARHAKVAVPCLLRRFKNASSLFHGPIVGMLIQAVAKGKSDLDAATVQTVKQITLSALRDPDEGLKIPTVEALELFGEADLIPALRGCGRNRSRSVGALCGKKMGRRGYGRDSEESRPTLNSVFTFSDSKSYSTASTGRQLPSLH
jgi:hypothetical protein